MTGQNHIYPFIFTCPYCRTAFDENDFTDLETMGQHAKDHMKACRDHAAAEAVRAAMLALTDKRDSRGVPIYAVPGRH